MAVRHITQGHTEAITHIILIKQLCIVYMHNIRTVSLCIRIRLKDTYTRRDVVTVHFDQALQWPSR